MLKGFKDFLLRGNVLDLAVAVVIGAAFTAIVTAFTSNIINPLVASIGGANEYGWGIQLTGDSAETFLNFGAVVTAIINFIIIAAVVYFVLIVPCECGEEEVRLRARGQGSQRNRSAHPDPRHPLGQCRWRRHGSARQVSRIGSAHRSNQALGQLSGGLIYFSTAVVRGPLTAQPVVVRGPRGSFGTPLVRRRLGKDVPEDARQALLVD